jgi:hypothetical protein
MNAAARYRNAYPNSAVGIQHLFLSSQPVNPATKEIMKESDPNYQYYVRTRARTLQNIPDSLDGITVRQAEDDLHIVLPGITQAKEFSLKPLVALVDETVAWLQGESGEGNPFGDEAMKRCASHWSGWIFLGGMLRQRIFTGIYDSFRYRRDWRGQWEWEIFDFPDDPDFDPPCWVPVDDARLLALLDRMEIAVMTHLSSHGQVPMN